MHCEQNSQTMRAVNSGKVLPNDGRVLFSSEMGKLGRFNSEDNFGAGKALLIQKGFDTFGVGSCGQHDISPTHNTKKSFLLQKSFHLDLPVIIVGLIELVERQ